MIKFLPLLLICNCISLPQPLDLERGACVVTHPDREDICLEVTLEECISSLGEYNGDGSTCDGIIPLNSIATEPSSFYLNKTVIYSVGGAITAIAVALASNIAIRRRRKHGTK